jgi:hypothetical protein
MADSQSRKPSQDNVEPKRGKTQKKPYRAPELTEYGSVSKLTQGAVSIKADAKGGGFASKVCL